MPVNPDNLNIKKSKREKMKELIKKSK